MKKFNGFAVPRHQVFTLVDGAFVVYWDEKYVQELLTGRYRPYEHKTDFGHTITDYELRQLKSAGCVEHFNRRHVWLYALPERGRFRARTMGRGDRVRVYYLVTSLPRSQRDNVLAVLQNAGLDDDFTIDELNSFVIIHARENLPFASVKQAEEAQEKLEASAPDFFLDAQVNLAIAFVESKVGHDRNETDVSGANLNLDEIIASQGDTSVTDGRSIVLAVSQDDEREAFDDLLVNDLKMQVHHAPTGEEAIFLMEDHNPDLLIVDLHLPDMHAWKMLGKLKESVDLNTVPIIVIMDDQTVVPLKNVTAVVRPISMARLRHTIWTLLRKNQNNE